MRAMVAALPLLKTQCNVGPFQINPCPAGCSSAVIISAASDLSCISTGPETRCPVLLQWGGQQHKPPGVAGGHPAPSLCRTSLRAALQFAALQHQPASRTLLTVPSCQAGFQPTPLQPHRRTLSCSCP